MTTKQKPRIIACIPAYNEEKTIAKIVILTQKYADKVIVVDDGSTDMTAEIAQKLGAIVLKHNKNMGKGAALKTALQKAKQLNPDIIITLDADGQHNPNEIPKLIKPILEGKADIVIGSRFLQKTNIPTYRKIGLKIIELLHKPIIKGITDTQSGFRAYTQKAAETLAEELTAKGYATETEQIYIAQKHGLKIAEVPIKVNYNVENPSKKNIITHTSQLITNLIKIMAIEKPLTYLGIPGIISITAAIPFTIKLILLYNQTRYFSIPMALIALGAFLLGIVLLISAAAFYIVSTTIKTRK